MTEDLLFKDWFICGYWEDISKYFCKAEARDRHEMFRVGLAENICHVYETNEDDIVPGKILLDEQKRHIRILLREIVNDFGDDSYLGYLSKKGESIPESVGVFGNLFYHLDEQDDEEKDEYPNAKLLLDFLGYDIEGTVLDSIRDIDSSFGPVPPYKSLQHEGIAMKLLASSGRLTKRAQRN